MSTPLRRTTAPSVQARKQPRVPANAAPTARFTMATAYDAPSDPAPSVARLTMATAYDAPSDPAPSVARLAMVTAYDAPSARIAHRAGADLILVGDSLAMVMLGYDDTLSVTVDDIAHHTAAVARGLAQSEAAGCDHPRPLVVGDLPWMSYHVSTEETVRNAAALIRAGAGSVKLEGGTKRLPMIRAILDAEIPVMGHLGLTPQSVNAFGGFKVQGKAANDAAVLIADALALQAAGCFAIVLEAVPDALATEVTAALSIPTIGIGAGAGCDGQVLVWHDLLGFEDRLAPKFVRRYAELGVSAQAAVASYVADVRSGSFPSVAESYAASPALIAALAARHAPIVVGGPDDGADLPELTCVAGLGDQAEEFLAGLYGSR